MLRVPIAEDDLTIADGVSEAVDIGRRCGPALAVIDPRLADARLAKPYPFSDFPRSMRIVADIVATGTTASPLAQGPHVVGKDPIPFPVPLHG